MAVGVDEVLDLHRALRGRGDGEEAGEDARDPRARAHVRGAVLQRAAGGAAREGGGAHVLEHGERDGDVLGDLEVGEDGLLAGLHPRAVGHRLADVALRAVGVVRRRGPVVAGGVPSRVYVDQGPVETLCEGNGGDVECIWLEMYRKTGTVGGPLFDGGSGHQSCGAGRALGSLVSWLKLEK